MYRNDTALCTAAIEGDKIVKAVSLTSFFLLFFCLFNYIFINA